MNPIINLSIDVTKITKEKLFQGKKGKYLNATMIPSKSEYGDYMIVESVSKEERLKGVKGQIIGNGKLVEPRPSKPEATPENQSDDSVPF